ncbi:hypothetical protein HMPREF3067_04360 [Corynebacterium sp. HMSC04H06]|nr:hypothetical protein HMPREF3067_04360 [Corynebacterium sp. HMSC04H06]
MELNEGISRFACPGATFVAFPSPLDCRAPTEVETEFWKADPQGAMGIKARAYEENLGRFKACITVDEARKLKLLSKPNDRPFFGSAIDTECSYLPGVQKAR